MRFALFLLVLIVGFLLGNQLDLSLGIELTEQVIVQKLYHFFFGIITLKFFLNALEKG